MNILMILKLFCGPRIKVVTNKFLQYVCGRINPGSQHLQLFNVSCYSVCSDLKPTKELTFAGLYTHQQTVLFSQLSMLVNTLKTILLLSLHTYIV